MSEVEITRRDFLKISALWGLRLSLVSAGGVAYATALEPNWVDVERVDLTMPNLASEFNGYRVAQISDLHMGDWTNSEHLAEVVSIVNRLQPDLIAMTGDFVTNNPAAQAASLVANLSNLKPKDAVVGVLGNHDYHDPRLTRGVMSKSKIIDLSNKVHTLQRGDATFHIGGVDDVYFAEDRLDLVLANMPKKGAAMLLAHEPDFADTSAASGRFDLQISGHSHGGQVVVPHVGPIQLPELGRKYPIGMYKVGDMIQYTNRGIGMVRPHVRINCRPEITLYTLKAGA